MRRRVCVTAHAEVRQPGHPDVDLVAPNWHTLAWGIDARVSMDTMTLRATYAAIRSHLIHFGELPLDEAVTAEAVQ